MPKQQMESETNMYQSPVLNVIAIDPEGLLASSNMENLVERDEMDW